MTMQVLLVVAVARLQNLKWLHLKHTILMQKITSDVDKSVRKKN